MVQKIDTAMNTINVFLLERHKALSRTWTDGTVTWKALLVLVYCAAVILLFSTVVALTPIVIFVNVILLLIVFLRVAMLAWRWVLSTLAIFVALVAVNFAYVQWLE
jgi:hypothetical protein